MELVEIKNILVRDYMPSASFTGNIRTCAYLDTSEPKHSKLPHSLHHRSPIRVIRGGSVGLHLARQVAPPSTPTHYQGLPPSTA